MSKPRLIIDICQATRYEATRYEATRYDATRYDATRYEATRWEGMTPKPSAVAAGRGRPPPAIKKSCCCCCCWFWGEVYPPQPAATARGGCTPPWEKELLLLLVGGGVAPPIYGRMAGSDMWKMFLRTFEGIGKYITFFEIVTVRADRCNVCLCMQMANGYMENVRMNI